MIPSYTFISIENGYTQNNLNKFAVYTHFSGMKGNTKKLNKSVTEMEAGLRKPLEKNRIV